MLQAPAANTVDAVIDPITPASPPAAFSSSLSKEELQRTCIALGISSAGHKSELRKRIRKSLNKTRDEEAAAAAVDESESDDDGSTKQPFDFYLVFDVEATCEENDRNYPHEIIEFPVVLIDARRRRIPSTSTSTDPTSESKSDRSRPHIAAEFHRYVRPTINPHLTPFCTSLTGITQSTVDSAEEFTVVLQQFLEWLTVTVGDTNPFPRCRWVTDGPWDIRDFITKQCKASGIEKPVFWRGRRAYVDLRRVYEKRYGVKENLNGMLVGRGMEFVGRMHSGIDDSRNIARIVLSLMDDGVVFA